MEVPRYRIEEGVAIVGLAVHTAVIQRQAFQQHVVLGLGRHDGIDVEAIVARRESPLQHQRCSRRRMRRRVAAAEAPVVPVEMALDHAIRGRRDGQTDMLLDRKMEAEGIHVVRVFQQPATLLPPVQSLRSRKVVIGLAFEVRIGRTQRNRTKHVVALEAGDTDHVAPRQQEQVRQPRSALVAFDADALHLVALGIEVVE